MKAKEDFTIGIYSFKKGEDVSAAIMYLDAMRQRDVIVEDTASQNNTAKPPAKAKE